MVGDLANFVFRLRWALPTRWFAEESPNLTALLTSIATPWVWLYGIINYAISQTRLSTATEYWLDLISSDYFGSDLPRNSGEGDTAYRLRIQASLLAEAATRSAVSTGLAGLTGSRPTIFEPANCADTGSYGGLGTYPNPLGGGMAYGQVGGWGNLNLPLQFFITTSRPAMPGIGMLAGYGISTGGYGKGSASYADLLLLPGHISDADIQATLCNLLPVNAVAWMRIN